VRSLFGLLPPPARKGAGNVLFDGVDVAHLDPATLRTLCGTAVGYVFQDPDHQLFAATVGEEVAFGPRNLGLSRAEVDERVAEALAAVDLHERAADPFLLDKGARQRLAVASILALRPDLVVTDLMMPRRTGEELVRAVRARPELAVQIEADDFRYAQPVVSQRQIGGDVGMSQARRQAPQRAVGHGVGVGAEDQRARERVALFRKDHVADALAGVKLADALLLDPLARAFLRDRILLPDRRVVMVEHDHDLIRITHFVAAHLAEEVGCAGCAAIVEHDVIGSHIDDLADFDAFPVGVPGDDF